MVQGRLRQRSFDTREGEKRTVTELDVDEVGVSLRFATAKVNKAGRSGGRADAAGPVDDPWGSVPSPAMATAGAGAPPF